MKHAIALLIIWFIPFTGYANTKQSTSTNQVTGAQTWETHVDGVLFSLTQILPDQLRAFYVNRGFTVEQIESYASSCVYMTVLRNDSAPGEIHFVSNNWSILTDSNSHQIKSVSEWLESFKKRGIKKSAILAFRWAQFPPEQEYKPGGDWNQGMLSIGLPPGITFNVIARWDIAENEYKAKLAGVQCAK
ncbi:MAG: hypothetical protein GY763_08775 [Gammaproteobacteria bacterium]|nr:hypothetical protein [Gammaproteobacteria bacterium]